MNTLRHVDVSVMEADGSIKKFEAWMERSTSDHVFLILEDASKLKLCKDDICGIVDHKVKVKKEAGSYLIPKDKKEKVELKEGELKPLKVGSMLWKVVELMKEHPTKSRKEIIDLIIKTEIMTSSAGASTYHQMAKKYLPDHGPVVETKEEETFEIHMPIVEGVFVT